METTLTTLPYFGLGFALFAAIVAAVAVLITSPCEMLANNLAKLSLLIALIGLGVQLYPPDIMKQSTLPIEAETEAVEFTPPEAVEFTQPDVTFSPVGGPNVTPIVGFSIIFLGTVIIAVLAYVLGMFVNVAYTSFRKRVKQPLP